MRCLIFREREGVSIGPAGEISELEAEGIAKLAERLPSGVLTWGHRSLKFGPFCGVLQTEQLAIEILPKIDHSSDSSEDMRGLLVAMLARAGELGSKRVGEAGLGQQHSHLLDVFIEDFCSQVKSALRGGAIARYTERTENLNAIRGRIELTEHLRANAFDRSHLLCRFDERMIDNLYNQSLKSVLRILLGFALSPRTRAMVAALLHRFDEVSDRRVTVRGVGALRFDRTIRNWEPVFARAHRLLSGLYPDVRIGDAAGSALLFNMEKLFETVLGLRIRHAFQTQHGGRLSVRLQSPVKNLATAGFQLRPDIAIQSGDETVAVLDAKWKRLDLGEANSGVSSGDAYQMNAYAGRYRCKRLVLVYPASRDCPPGRITQFVLMTEERPVLDVVAVDVRELAFGSGIPAGIDAMIPVERNWKQRTSTTPIFEAI
ncbi:McrC family protein [Oceanicella actignis]|uniref:5-methylcytosine-specific restriction enzyme subunit McrC n=1 Tax=Oceanicella actignis TaxID=1189325 RepID=A0A1M7U5F1_9RHOB|nr:restriction endonuclease [Oceanicella actignis]SET87850.1 5-methylcytosine-specific restriction enzyme subunit McrC [Oceanicella actignis]SHN78125.1 5-methylcytosine-specific restriction enzyme subunit McrC [Oceanicella actignis]